MSIAFLALFLLGQVGLGIDRTTLPATPKPVSCATSADPAIDSASQEQGDTKDGVDTFLIHVSVINRGGNDQGKRIKQVVDIFRNEEKIARINVPALEKGEAYAFTARYKRNSDAGRNSTTLLLRLGGLNYAPLGIEDCNQSNNSFYLTF
jgi:hypothetical protein